LQCARDQRTTDGTPDADKHARGTHAGARASLHSSACRDEAPKEQGLSAKRLSHFLPGSRALKKLGRSVPAARPLVSAGRQAGGRSAAHKRQRQAQPQGQTQAQANAAKRTSARGEGQAGLQPRTHLRTCKQACLARATLLPFCTYPHCLNSGTGKTKSLRPPCHPPEAPHAQPTSAGLTVRGRAASGLPDH